MLYVREGDSLLMVSQQGDATMSNNLLMVWVYEHPQRVLVAILITRFW